MTLLELNDEIKGLEKDYNEVYNSIVDFTNYMINKGFSLDNVKASFKSVSTYVDYSKEIDGFDEIITVRFSDHSATGNYGTTDVYYGTHLTLDENYESVLEILEDR